MTWARDAAVRACGPGQDGGADHEQGGQGGDGQHAGHDPPGFTKIDQPKSSMLMDAATGPGVRHELLHGGLPPRRRKTMCFSEEAVADGWVRLTALRKADYADIRIRAMLR
jgi:hypothetical protein